MESWLHWLLAGAWIYAILRIEKVAYDLRKLGLSQQFSYGDEGLNVRAMSIATEDSVLRPEVDRQGMAVAPLGNFDLTPAAEVLGEGDKCPECPEGFLGVQKVEGRTCFISPPCNACVTNPLTCNNCGHQEHP